MRPLGGARALMGNRLKPCGDPSLRAVFLCCGYTPRMYLELRRKNRLLFFGGQWGGVKNSHRIQFQIFLKVYELRIAKNTFFATTKITLAYFSIFKFGLFYIGEQNPFLQSPNSWIQAGQHDHNFLLCLNERDHKKRFPYQTTVNLGESYIHYCFRINTNLQFLGKVWVAETFKSATLHPHVIKTMATTGDTSTGLLHDGLALSVQCTGSLVWGQPWESATGRWATVGHGRKRWGVFTKLGWKSRVKWRVWISSFICWW